MNKEEYQEKVSRMKEKILELREKNPYLTLQYAEQLKEIGEEKNDQQLVGFALFFIGESYYLQNDIQRECEYMLQGLEVQIEVGDYERAAKTYNYLGFSMMRFGNCVFAMNYFQEGLKLCETYGFELVQGVIYLNIGLLYLGYENMENAILYLTQAKGLIEQLYPYVGYSEHMVDACCLMANAYLNIGKEVLARKMMEELESPRMEETVLGKVSKNVVFARLAHASGDEKEVRRHTEIVIETLKEDVLLLDFFEETQILCNCLYQWGEYALLGQLNKEIKNRKITSEMSYLKLQCLDKELKYARAVGDREQCEVLAMEYYETSQVLEKETRVALSSMVDLRFTLEHFKKKNLILQSKVEKDPLTHLPNRYKLNKYARKTFEMAQKEGILLAVEMLDIDYFKEYNDNYGHQAGDEILCAIAQYLRELNDKEHVFCARYGGDEFILIFEGIPMEDVKVYVSWLQKKVQEKQIPHEFSKCAQVVTVSQGVCYGIPQKEDKMWDFLYKADEALYEGKKLQRDTIVYTEK